MNKIFVKNAQLYDLEENLNLREIMLKRNTTEMKL